MHGAQFGNLPFVAHDAVIIEAMPYMPPFDGANDHSYYQVSLVKELAPVSGITMLEYDSPAAHTTKLRMDVLLKVSWIVCCKFMFTMITSNLT